MGRRPGNGRGLRQQAQGSGSKGSHVPLSTSCGDTLSDTFLSHPLEYHDLSYICLLSLTEGRQVPCRWWAQNHRDSSAWFGHPLPVPGATLSLGPPVLLHPVLLTRLTLGMLQGPRWRLCVTCAHSQSLLCPGSCAGHRGMRECAQAWPLHGPCPTGVADASGMVGHDVSHIQESVHSTRQ